LQEQEFNLGGIREKTLKIDNFQLPPPGRDITWGSLNLLGY